MHERNSFNQHNNVRRPGVSHRGAGRKKKSSDVAMYVKSISPPCSLYSCCILAAAYCDCHGLDPNPSNWGVVPVVPVGVAL